MGFHTDSVQTESPSGRSKSATNAAKWLALAMPDLPRFAVAERAADPPDHPTVIISRLFHQERFLPFSFANMPEWWAKKYEFVRKHVRTRG
jgi:hypothetical protein